jgi:hypothetical protein
MTEAVVQWQEAVQALSPPYTMLPKMLYRNYAVDGSERCRSVRT